MTTKTYKKLVHFHLQKIPSVSRNSDQYKVHKNRMTQKPETSGDVTETDMAPSKLQQSLFLHCYQKMFLETLNQR